MKPSRSTKLLCSLLFAAGCVPDAAPEGPDAGVTDDDVIATHEGDVGRLRVQTPEGLRTITYMVHNGHAIHEGDIDLGTIEHVQHEQHLRGGAVSLGDRWPNARVFFRFGSTFSGSVCGTSMTNCTDIRTLVRNTLTAMGKKLPVAFVEDTANTAANYVKLDWADADSNFGGSSNSIGMDGGEQTIVFPIGHVKDQSLPQSIPYNIQPNAGTLRHEMLHAIGLWHEQSRTDRDSFVTINTDCIQSGQTSQFDIQSGATSVGPYDFNSIMHYAPNTYCIPWTFAAPDPDGDGCACASMTSKLAGVLITPPGRPLPGGFSIEDTNTLYRIYTRSPLSDAAGDHYGQAVASGDFDGDGYDDLAVGIPDEDVITSVFPLITSTNAGKVVLYKGTSAGLVLWNTLTELDFAGSVTANGHFGTALVAADLDADGITDLAVGAPGANGNSGAVFTFLGNGTRIPAADRMLTQQTAGYTDEAGDRFGEVLAAGPITGQKRLDSCNSAFDGNVYNALVIGAPSDRNGVPFSAGLTTRNGAVYMFQEVVNCGDQLAHATRVTNGRAATGDDFGGALAVGDLDGDGKADVAIGAPHRSANAGAVYTYGGRLPAESPILWSSMVTSAATLSGGASEQYGSALAIGDIASAFTGSELVVGAPGLNGTVKVLAGGLTPLLVQTLANFPAASGDRFGAALAIGNVDAATSAVDLVVGIPGQDSGAGAIAIIRGGALTPRTKVRQSDLSPVFDNAPNDGFGTSLAIGQLDGRGPVASTASNSTKLLDLAIGGPGEAPDLSPFGQGPAGSGAVSLMKGTAAAVVAPWAQITQPFDGHM